MSTKYCDNCGLDLTTEEIEEIVPDEKMSVRSFCSADCRDEFFDIGPEDYE